MKLVLSIILLIILLCSSKYMFEDFTLSIPASQTTQSESNETTQSGSSQTTQASSREVSYFELNNEAQNLVNAHKNEVSLRELQHEEESMRNNVRKIVNHAHNVLSFIDLNKDYLERNLQSGGSE